MAEHVSGLAASIRAATESETFDLAGHSAASIQSTATDAFADPLPLTDMVRLTFVTGAGKLGRQKYDADAAKVLASTLRGLGYEEDRAASCVPECAGTYKMQHDTGKNLKTLVVFPRITSATAGAGTHEDGEDAGIEGRVGEMSLGAGGESIPPEGTPERLIAVSSAQVFGRMLASKCYSWGQKKGCLGALHEVKSVVEGLDERLRSGTPLGDDEQDFYDAVSADALAEKEATVRTEMHGMVERGELTAREREMLLTQVGEKIDALTKEIDDARRQEKTKRVEKLSGMREKALARREMLEKIEPKAPHRLRHESEISKLRMELRPLQKIEDGAKGRLLSVRETQAVGRKTEILDQIEGLEEASRGWFEDNDVFASRVEASRAAARAKEKAKPGKKSMAGGAGGYKAKPVTNWVTPGAAKKKAWGSGAGASKKKTSTGGSVFAAMMDSDTDSD